MAHRKFCYKCRRALTPENVIVQYGRRHCKACLLAYKRPPKPPRPVVRPEPLPGEQWLPVPGYEGFYEVSDLGRVWSVPRWKVPGGLLKPTAGVRNTYATVKLFSGTKASARTWYVHVLVAVVFCEGRAPGLEVRHLDGDNSNNVASNLMWDTHQVNQQDMVGHGTHLNARKTHCKRGHPFDEANTYWRPNGHRACRKCVAESQRRYRERLGYRVRR